MLRILRRLGQEQPLAMSSEDDTDEPLPLEAAFRRWSDKAAIEHLYELKRYSHPPMIFIVGPGAQPDAYELAHGEWCRRFMPLHDTFVARLRSGELVATGYAQPLAPTSRRMRIEPELFELLKLDYEEAEATFGDLAFIRVEVSRPPCPAGTAVIPATEPDEGVAPSLPGRTFKHNSSYTWVAIGGHRFVLAGGQCLIIKSLHQASLSDNPWVANKVLLAEANYNSATIGGVFRRHTNPSWRELIDTLRGHSRLNL